MRYKTLFPTLIALALFAAAVIFGCPIYQIFGVQCPGCGMTRAFLCAVCLDFKAAFQHHPLFGIFMLEAVYVLFRNPILKRIKIPQKLELAVGIISLALLLIVWIFRQFII
ncbi:MAG: DUF2752 domain-containing protein [Oscillospiraceae bacterium]|nr:DUF2752 domain-containing protein [Oscillospiraceae bacterium]